MSIVTLKPGLLVSLHTRLEGGVRYTRVDLEAGRSADDTSTVAKWETTRVVEDAEEHARAVKVRGKCVYIVRSVCSQSAFGLLCASSSEKALDAAIAEARVLADTFNASAQSTRISIYALKGRIAESDGEAARAIASELRELLDNMKAGIDAADVAAIREAANKAKKVGSMLDEATANKVSAAIDEARAVAREIVKRAVSGGEDAATVVQGIQLKALDEARFAFLDLDTVEVAKSETLPPIIARPLDVDSEEVEEQVKANVEADIDAAIAASDTEA